MGVDQRRRYPVRQIGGSHWLDILGRVLVDEHEGECKDPHPACAVQGS